MNKKKRISIMFVCMGNICRSPAGEGVMKQIALREELLSYHVESSGIGDWHCGQPPDARIQEAAQLRGINLTSVAQQFQDSFLDCFDYILAADQEVLNSLKAYAKTPEHKSKIHLMTAFSSIYKGLEIPDPYYEPHRAFEIVLDMLEDSCNGLAEHIRKTLN